LEPVLSSNLCEVNLQDIFDVASLSKGWNWKDHKGKAALAAEFGGNELRFTVHNSKRVVLRLATEHYAFMHVFADDQHHTAIGPEQDLEVNIPLSKESSEIRILRTAVSSGPFYVDAFLKGVSIDEGGRIGAAADPIPTTVFCTFGDSISGNCCIGGPGPFDPYGLGYGYEIAERFAWQYYNTARDGSAVCCTPFDNPLAHARVQKEVIDEQPNYLLVFYGTNDIRGQIPVEQFQPAYHDLIRQLVAGLPNARIALSGLLWNDMNTVEEITRFNAAIDSTAADLKLPCCQPFDAVPRELIEDGVHPNAAGQRTLAKVFGDFFAAQWPEIRK
jgi:lysophospholipase L1-like esterase